MHNNKIILAIFAVFTLLAAGCTISPEQLVTANPIVKDFLRQYPNAEVKITFFSKAESERMLNSIKEDCGKDSLQAKNYYKVTIEDPTSGLFILSWLDWDNKIVECVLKKSQIRNENAKGSLTDGLEEAMPVIEPSKSTRAESRTEEDVQETTSISAILPSQPTVSTPIESESEQSEAEQCSASCDDGNKCTFDYCNSFTEFECKHKLIEPCFNDGVCEEEETSLPLAPSCPNLGWVAAGKVSSGASLESQAEKGYYSYKNSINSGQNSDCPESCDDSNPSTSDYYDFKKQECGHYACVKDTTLLKITVSEPQENLVIVSNSANFRFKINKNGQCTYILDSNAASDWINMVSDVETSQSLTGLAQGNHEIYVRCYDTSNNVQTYKAHFSVDLNPPSIEIYTPIGTVSGDWTRISVRTNVESKCSYSWEASGVNFSDRFGPAPMDETGAMRHSQQLNSLHNSSTYIVSVACNYMDYSNTVSKTFKVDFSNEEGVVFPT